jgi:hypothetical protein
VTPPPAAAATPAVRPRSAPRRAVRAPGPRRISGPAKRKTATGSSAARVRAYVPARGGAIALPAPGGLAASLLEALAGVSRQRLLDRLIRGRAWIGLLAFALIGIVAMQLWVVKLGVGIGRALEHEGLLQRENATLSIEDAQLSSGERVEQMAAARGMVVAAPGALRFETVRGGLDARLAAAALARGGQVASASTDTGTTASSSTATEASTSQGESAAGGASTETSTETSAASTVGSTESASATSGDSTGSSEGSAASSESTTPASGVPSTAGTAPASGESTAPSSTATSTGGATSASEAATSGGGTGAVGADGGAEQPAVGG